MNERFPASLPERPVEESSVRPEHVPEELPEGVLLSKEGKPLLLYRGSSLPVSLSKEEKYHQAHLGHSTEAASAGEAFFFTDRRKTADYYSRGKNPNKESAVRGGGDPHIDNVYLVMRNPLVHDFKGKINRHEEETYFNLIRKAKEEGHDGVIFKNTFDAGELSRFAAILDGNFFGETIYGVFDCDHILIQETEALVSAKKKEKIAGAAGSRAEQRLIEEIRYRLKVGGETK